MNKSNKNRSILYSDRNFINFILILTIVEIVAFIYRLFLQVNIDETFHKRINIAILLFALSPYILLAFAYLHKYWITAFILKCIVIFTEITKTKFIFYIINIIDVNPIIVSRVGSILQILFLMSAFILIYKFKKVKKHPKFYSILKIN
jgi:hypothetical protein